MSSKHALLLQCGCSQRSWIPNYSFNLGTGLDYGTPYSCPACGSPLGSEHLITGSSPQQSSENSDGISYPKKEN